ncbi:MAG TPA: hypothetical protein VFK10_14820, partial [Burkholderiaceae bacterium]|nr:hypothetical protein [Burkholderiaceae bacterium]
MPRPAMPAASFDLAEPAAPHRCAAPAMAMHPQTRPITAVVMDALAQSTEALQTLRGLLQPLGGPRGWSWGGLWQPSTASSNWRCDTHWQARDAATTAQAVALTQPAADDCSVFDDMLAAHAVAHVVELRAQPRTERTTLALRMELEIALRVPLRVGDRTVGVLEWLGRMEVAQACELLAHAELVGRTLG